MKQLSNKNFAVSAKNIHRMDVGNSLRKPITTRELPMHNSCRLASQPSSPRRAFELQPQLHSARFIAFRESSNYPTYFIQWDTLYQISWIFYTKASHICHNNSCYNTDPREGEIESSRAENEPLIISAIKFKSNFIYFPCYSCVLAQRLVVGPKVHPTEPEGFVLNFSRF